MKLALDLTTAAAIRAVVGPPEPDPVELALLATRAGADVIGVNVKGERSYIGERDCLLLRDVLKVPFILKISTSNELVKFAVSLKPAAVVLLPERREDLPLEDGLDVVLNQTQVKRAQMMLRESGIDVAAFINPSIDQIKSCHKLDIARVELNTLKFAESGREEDLQVLRECARLAHKLNLQTWAGRGLTAASMRRLAGIPELDELHIGRLFFARAIIDGIGPAVVGLKSLIDRAAARPA